MASFFVLIPVFNPPESFIVNIEKIVGAEPDLMNHIVIIDDGSTNDVIHRLKAKYPEIRILRGDGSLWWCGGMRLGMEHALKMGVEVVVWLNHDCTPDVGTLYGLTELANAEGTGAVSAWCYCREDKDYGVNPGFVSFNEIPINQLKKGGLIPVDGVNGNCTAISISAIRKVGQPHAERHPHYGDGPYTWRLHQAGFRNYVAPHFRAALDREFERCIDEADHSMFWKANLQQKLAYYFFSYRSKYHWKYRLHDLCAFRGALGGLIAYFPAQIKILSKVMLGHFRRRKPFEQRLEDVLSRYAQRYPVEALRRDILKLHNRNS